MPSIECDWKTVADWEALTAQDPGTFDHLALLGGDTYVRVCLDGTVWLNATLVLGFLNVP